MKVKLTSGVVLLVLIVTAVVLAQQSGPTIGQLRAEIQKRESLDIPEDLKELNNRRLKELRASLHPLLEQEIQKLITYKNSLSLTPDEAKTVDERIQSYQGELKKLEDALPIATLVAAPSPLPAQPPAAVPAPTPAVAPVSASAGTNGQTTQRSCAAQDALSEKEKNAKVISQVDYKLCDLLNFVKKRSDRQIKLTGPGNPDYFDLLVILIAKRSTPKFLVEAEEARVDKQVGSTPANSGSTSQVVKGGAPAILGFAVENGALTQSSIGTTMTFRGNPLGIYQGGRSQAFSPLANNNCLRSPQESSSSTNADQVCTPKNGMIFLGSRRKI